MITTLASILEQVTSGLHVQLFLLFTLAVWGVWAYKLWLARSYRPIEGSFAGTVTIVIPTFREVPARLQDAIATALRQDPLEVIVVVDEREPQTRTNVIQTFGDEVLTIVATVRQKEGGRSGGSGSAGRHRLGDGIRRAHGGRLGSESVGRVLRSPGGRSMRIHSGDHRAAQPGFAGLLLDYGDADQANLPSPRGQ